MDMGIINAILNGGALAILGYWIIYGLPKTIKDGTDLHASLVRELMADHKEDRESNERIRVELAKAIEKLAESTRNICLFKNH